MAIGNLEGLTKSYFDLRWHLDPVGASQSGVTSHDSRLGRFGKTTLAPHLAAMKSLSTALEEVATEGLDEEIDRTALLNDLRVTQARFEKEQPQARNPEFWLSHLLNGLYVLLARKDRPDDHRARALVQRLEEVPGFLEDARATLTEPVRVFCETGRLMTAGGLPLVREVGLAVGRLGGDLDPERVTAAVAGATAALQSFGKDLDRWRESGSDRFALGEEAFNFRLHYEHVLRDTAPELWRYGHRLKEEVEAELTALAQRLDGKRSWRDLIGHLRQEHPSALQLVPAYAKAMERARQFVETRKIAPLPTGALEVVSTPEFLRPLIPFAAYEAPGTYSADRTGWFYVTAPEAGLAAAQEERVLRDHCRWEISGIALHEGYPGHHLHILHAQEQPSPVRKLISTPLTIEGWALYCEELMAEEGFYENEEERFFQRVHLLWRATRVLLDVGLHTRGLTFDQGVDQLVSLFGVERASAEAEVRRYCAWPAYQLCYAVGRRELLSLREDFRAARGRGYTFRDFHNAILPYGGLPVSLIRWGLGLA